VTVRKDCLIKQKLQEFVSGSYAKAFDNHPLITQSRHRDIRSSNFEALRDVNLIFRIRINLDLK